MSSARRTSALLTSLHDKEPLHAIEEEALQKEGSQSHRQQAKSNSMRGGGRPGTPEFNLEGELSDDENDKE